MRTHFKWDKKYLYWGITAFCVVAAAILFYMALNYLPSVVQGLASVIRILSPFIWGFAISYILLPLVKLIDEKFLAPRLKAARKKKKKSGDGSGLSRGIAVLVAEIVFLAVLTLLVYMIIPQLIESINTISTNGNSYIETTTTWLEGILANYPEIEKDVLPMLENFNDSALEWVRTTLLPSLGSFATSLTSGVISVFKAIYNLIIGIIVSCYILASHEKFAASTKRMLYSIFSVETTNKLLDGVNFVDKTFIGFINGKLLDSLIIAIICYVGCAILDMPYALLVSAIIGVTNIIPFFGPVIGLVPASLLILLVNPLKSLIFIIFIILLQQLDGNFIGPKILGNTVGVSGFWIMFSIIVGAGFFDFWGMLLGVPVFVVIYTLINKQIDRKLKNNGLPVDSAEYSGIDHIDPDTLEPVPEEPQKQKTLRKSEDKKTPAQE